MHRVGKLNVGQFGKVSFERHAYAQGLNIIRKRGQNHDYEVLVNGKRLRVAVRCATSDQKQKGSNIIPRNVRTNKPLTKDDIDILVGVTVDRWGSNNEPVDNCYIFPASILENGKKCITINPYSRSKYNRHLRKWNNFEEV